MKSKKQDKKKKRREQNKKRQHKKEIDSKKLDEFNNNPFKVALDRSAETLSILIDKHCEAEKKVLMAMEDASAEQDILRLAESMIKEGMEFIHHCEMQLVVANNLAFTVKKRASTSLDSFLRHYRIDPNKMDGPPVNLFENLDSNTASSVMAAMLLQEFQINGVISPAMRHGCSSLRHSEKIMKNLSQEATDGMKSLNYLADKLGSLLRKLATKYDEYTNVSPYHNIEINHPIELHYMPRYQDETFTLEQSFVARKLRLDDRYDRFEKALNKVVELLEGSDDKARSQQILRAIDTGRTVVEILDVDFYHIMQHLFSIDDMMKNSDSKEKEANSKELARQNTLFLEETINRHIDRLTAQKESINHLITSPFLEPEWKEDFINLQISFEEFLNDMKDKKMELISHVSVLSSDLPDVPVV